MYIKQFNKQIQFKVHTQMVNCAIGSINSQFCIDSNTIPYFDMGTWWGETVQSVNYQFTSEEIGEKGKKSFKRGLVNFPPLKIASLNNLDDNGSENVGRTNNSRFLNFIGIRPSQFVKRGWFSRSTIRNSKKDILRRVNTSHAEVSRGSCAVTSRKCKKRDARACVQSCCFANICFFDVVLAAFVVGEDNRAKVGAYLSVSHP